MRYALNVAPVNGTETHLAFGTAEQDMTSAGDGYLEMHTAGQAAGMVLSTQGDSLVAQTGVGSAQMSTSATGIGFAVIHGDGAAQAVMEADGDGVILPFVGGRAMMVMSAAGIGSIAWRGDGLAAMVLQPVDGARNPVAATGAGLASMEMGGIAGIPNPIVAPQVFAATHKNRLISTANDNRTIRGG